MAFCGFSDEIIIANLSIENNGNGAEIGQDIDNNVINLRTITGSNSITVTQNSDEINISSPNNTITNLGSGNELLVDNLPNATIKSIIAGSGISITDNQDSIVINNIGVPGFQTLIAAGSIILTDDVNTATIYAPINTINNLGSGNQLIVNNSPTATIKSLVAGTNTSMTNDSTTITVNGPTYATNQIIGSSADITAAQVDNEFRFKPLNSGSNISIDESTLPGAITISATNVVNTLVNVGTGSEIGQNINTNILNLRTLTGSNAITLTQNANTIDISSPNNTITNLGSGNQLIVDDLPVATIKSLVAGTNIGMSNDATTITINGPTYASNVVAGSDADITAAQVGDEFRFKPLNSGSNISIDETTLPGAITINVIDVVNDLSNNGGGSEIGQDITAGVLNLRTLTSSNAITLTEDTNTINISAPNNTITNLGLGNQLIVDDLPNATIKSLVAGTNISITNDATTIIVNGPTYASNVVVGSDADITAAQVGNEMRFKPLNSGTNISIDESTLSGAITINGPTYSSNVVVGSDADITAAQVGDEMRFKPLNSGTNITIDEVTLPGAITINGPTYASNVVPGSDANITAVQVDNEMRFKPLNSGTNIIIDEFTLSGAITINATGVVNTLANVGGGNEIGQNITSGVLNLRTLTGSNAITLTQNANTINISSPVNTITNLGSGNQLLVNNLPTATIKSLVAGTNTSMTNDPTSITVNGPTYASNVVAGSDVDITAAQVGNEMRFKPLNSGSNISIDESTLPGAITISAIDVVNTLTNNGGGSEIGQNITSGVLNLRTVTSSNGITVTQNANTVDISLSSVIATQPLLVSYNYMNPVTINFSSNYQSNELLISSTVSAPPEEGVILVLTATSFTFTPAPRLITPVILPVLLTFANGSSTLLVKLTPDLRFATDTSRDLLIGASSTGALYQINMATLTTNLLKNYDGTTINLGSNINAIATNMNDNILFYTLASSPVNINYYDFVTKTTGLVTTVTSITNWTVGSAISSMSYNQRRNKLYIAGDLNASTLAVLSVPPLNRAVGYFWGNVTMYPSVFVSAIGTVLQSIVVDDEKIFGVSRPTLATPQWRQLGIIGGVAAQLTALTLTGNLKACTTIAASGKVYVQGASDLAIRRTADARGINTSSVLFTSAILFNDIDRSYYGNLS